MRIIFATLAISIDNVVFCVCDDIFYNLNNDVTESLKFGPEKPPYYTVIIVYSIISQTIV